MRKLLFSSILLSVFVYIGCKKYLGQSANSNLPLGDQLLVENAKSQFVKDVGVTFQDSTNLNPRYAIPKTPNWSGAVVQTYPKGKLVVIPILYKKNFSIHSSLDPGRLYQVNEMSKLIIYQDSERTYHEELVTDFPDSDFERSGQNIFSGIIKVESWNGGILHIYKYSQGHFQALSSRNLSTGDSEKRTGNIIADAVIPENMELSVCYTAEFYNYSVEDPDNGYYYSEDLGCTTVSVDDGDEGGGGAGGATYGGVAGGGSGSSAGRITITNNSILDTKGNNAISNIKNYMQCFTNSSLNRYSVTLMVDEPTPGSNASYSSTTDGGSSGLNVGHAFLVFQQTQLGTTTRRSVGLYPSGPVTPLTPSSAGILNDDEGHQYDVSLTINLNGPAFMNMINASSNVSNLVYNLNSNNCSTWVLTVLAAGGVTLNPPIGSWPFGSGEDPGDMGEYIRTIGLPSGWSRNVVGGNGYPNVGSCLAAQ